MRLLRAGEEEEAFAEAVDDAFALVGDDGHSVAFYGELSPALAAREEKLQQLWVPMLLSLIHI